MSRSQEDGAFAQGCQAAPVSGWAAVLLVIMGLARRRRQG
jgi:uncharacterized protein (TIGR03382 family)